MTYFEPRVNTDNPDPRVACILLLDTSASMNGSAITELNRGLQVFATDILEDPLARKRAEIMVVAFGGTVRPDPSFVEAQEFQAPTLTAGGGTPMAEAIIIALDALEAQKSVYKQAGIEYYRPWLVVMTDGAPTDGVQTINEALARLESAERRKAVTVFPIGVGDMADMGFLSRLSSERPAAALRDVQSFSTFFSWLSKSMSAVSLSGAHGSSDAQAAMRNDTIGQTPLPDPTGPTGWMQV
jgi:uncharacterized protein YegL